MKVKSIIFALLFFVFFTSPTQAHTELISVEPAAETALVTFPAEIKLNFADGVIADATFASITSESGSVTTTVRVEDRNVFISIPTDLVAPEITVAWKTAALDGHPLDGEIKYLLIQEESVPAPTPAEEIIEEEPVAISALIEENSSNITWLQWLSLGASIGIAITFFLKMRKK